MAWARLALDPPGRYPVARNTSIQKSNARGKADIYKNWQPQALSQALPLHPPNLYRYALPMLRHVMDQPPPQDGDGPIGIFRKWVKQFYTQSQYDRIEQGLDA